MQKGTLILCILSIFGLSLAACQPGASQTPIEIPTGDPAAGAPRLVGPVWKWVGFTDPLQSFEVEESERYTIQFNPDGTLNIQADCNNGVGEYTLDGQTIQIEIGRMTLVACPPDSRSDKYLQYLGAAAIHFFQEDELFIDLKMDSGTLRFNQ